MKSKLYFLNYKKFIISGFHLSQNISLNVNFSQKYFLTRYKNISLIDLRQTFSAFSQLVYFFQFFIKNFGFFLFFFNNSLLDNFFYKLTHFYKQHYYSSIFSNGLLSNNNFLKFKYLLAITNNIVILYFSGIFNKKILQEIWRLNIPVIGFGFFYLNSYMTYVIPINTLSLKTLYFLAVFSIQYVKIFIFKNKKYFINRKYFN